MDIRRVRTCEKCKAVVPLDRVRLVQKDKETNMFICDDCSAKLKQTVPKSPIRNIPANKKLVKCLRCNYSFPMDVAKVGLLYNASCPYCGKADRLQK